MPPKSKRLEKVPSLTSVLRCGFQPDGKRSRCPNVAVDRNASVARCGAHGGHHDYTERWNGSEWVPRPVVWPDGKVIASPPDRLFAEVANGQD